MNELEKVLSKQNKVQEFKGLNSVRLAIKKLFDLRIPLKSLDTGKLGQYGDIIIAALFQGLMTP